MNEQEENHDYEHKGSVRAQSSVKREKQDPKTGLEPISLWLFCICGLVLIVGGTYVGAKSAGLDFSQSALRDANPTPPAGYVPAEAELTPRGQWIKDGKGVYASVCAGCHQANGKGNGQIPPLVASEWVAEGSERFAQIIIKGLKGPITVAGASYGGQEMQPQGHLKDKQIAQVMSYVREKFAGRSDIIITEEMVAHARKGSADRAGQYTASELAAADAMLPGEQPAWANPEAAEGEAADGQEGEAPSTEGEPTASVAISEPTSMTT